MYTIGQLSKIVNVTPNTLRFYDATGLLKPYGVDKQNGYRQYTEQQARDLLAIQELKYFGFHLNEIKELMQAEAYEDGRLLKALLNKQKQYLQEEKSNQMKSRLLENKISQFHIPERIAERSLHMHLTKNAEKPKKILLLENVEFERKIMQDMLQLSGQYEIIAYASSKDVLEHYLEEQPDLILTGIVMPEIDGLYMIKLLREKFKDVHVIYCSYMSQLPVILTALKYGRTAGYISKPVTSGRLNGAILNFFEQGLEIDKSVQFCEEAENCLNQQEFSSLKNIELDQADIDSFFEVRHIADLPDYFQQLNQKHLETFSPQDNETDFIKIELCIALQEKINQLFMKTQKATTALLTCSIDLTWRHALLDYIIGKAGYTEWLLMNHSIPAGGISIAETLDQTTAEGLLDHFFALCDKAVKGNALSAGGQLNALTDRAYILSTFQIDGKTVLYLYLSTEVCY